MSYRSGRFGFSAAHVPALERLGYRIESSVAPLFYEAHKNGPDFVEAPLTPYYLAYDSATRPGTSAVLEVPVSAALNRRAAEAAAVSLRARAAATTRRSAYSGSSASRDVRWLRPSYSSLDDMIGARARPGRRRESRCSTCSSTRAKRSSAAARTTGPTRSSPPSATASSDSSSTRRGTLGASPATFAEFQAELYGTGPPTSRLGLDRARLVRDRPRHPASAARPGGERAAAVPARRVGDGARRRGRTSSLTRPRPAPDPRPDVTWIPRTKRSLWQKRCALGSIAGAWRIRRDAEDVLGAADLVHVHSNGLLPEVSAHRIAQRLGKPVVLTLYGTEIWHYRPKRLDPISSPAPTGDADAVTFYSQRLLERARSWGSNVRGCHVIYPPVAAVVHAFTIAAAAHARRAARSASPPRTCSSTSSGCTRSRASDTCSKRCPTCVREHPDTHLVICGTGALLPELQAVARSAGVERHVTFAGLVDNAVVARYCAAADLFVLPSLLEALPTVAVEALASGTPVVSSDNPGGVELQRRVRRRRGGRAEGTAGGARRRDQQRRSGSKRRTRARDAGASSKSASAPMPWRGSTSRSTAEVTRADDLAAIGRAAAAALLRGAARRRRGSRSSTPGIPRSAIEFDRDLPRNVSGVYPPERDDASGLTFAWTGADAVVRLPGLDRGKNWTLDLRVRGGRAGAGRQSGRHHPRRRRDVADATARPWSSRTSRVDIPARGERRGLTLGLRRSETFVPGPGDPRPLGVRARSARR